MVQKILNWIKDNNIQGKSVCIADVVLVVWLFLRCVDCDRCIQPTYSYEDIMILRVYI